jgi:1-acyl-sn-glycerol-3-phosphate acyltransferase
VIVLMRHASLADSLLPAVLLGTRGLRLRYVLKRELLWDPCLDVVGQRLPNAFIRRGSGESDAEIDAIRALGRDLGDDEGVLIYPEGASPPQTNGARAARGFGSAGAARARRSW